MKDRDSLILQERYLRQKKRLLNEAVPFGTGDEFMSLGKPGDDPYWTTKLAVGEVPRWNQFYGHSKKEGVLRLNKIYAAASPIITSLYQNGRTEQAQQLIITTLKIVGVKIKKYIEENADESGMIPENEEEFRMLVASFLRGITVQVRGKERPVYIGGKKSLIHIARNIVNNLVDADIIERGHIKGGVHSGKPAGYSASTGIDPDDLDISSMGASDVETDDDYSSYFS
jgi:hypothetical protein